MPVPPQAIAAASKLAALPVNKLKQIYQDRRAMKSLARTVCKSIGHKYATRPLYRWLRGAAAWEMISRPARQADADVIAHLTARLLPRAQFRKDRWTDAQRLLVASAALPAIRDAIPHSSQIARTIDLIYGHVEAVSEQLGEYHDEVRNVVRLAQSDTWTTNLSALPFGVAAALRNYAERENVLARRLADALTESSISPTARLNLDLGPYSLAHQGYLRVLAEFAAVHGESGKASAWFQQSADAGVDPLASLLRASQMERDRGNLTAADALLARADNISPNDVQAALLRAVAKEQMPEEIAPLARAVATDSSALPNIRLSAAMMLYYHCGDQRAGVHALRTLVELDAAFSGARHELARVLQRAATSGDQIDRAPLLLESVDLALAARDIRRRAEVSSANSVVLAAESLALLDRELDALGLCLSSHDGGTASDSEFKAAEVRGTAVGLAIDLGRVDLARRLLEMPGDPVDRIVIAQAALVDIGGSRVDAVRIAREELDSTTDVFRRLRLYEILASAGEWPLEGLDELDGLDHFTVQRLKATAEIESGRLQDAITRLRQMRPFKHPLIPRLLSRAHQRSGDIDEAIRVLHDGATQFHDASLRARCVVLLRDAGRIDDAWAAGETALRDLHSDTPLRREVRRWMVDLSWRRQRWDDAERVARLALIDDPNDNQTAWALIGALSNQLRSDQAWEEWQRLRPEPSSEREVELWIVLASQNAPADEWLEAAVDYADRYPDSPRVGGAFLFSTLNLSRRPEEDDESHVDPLTVRVRAANARTVTNHADALGIEAIPVTDFAKTLEDLTADMRARAIAAQRAANLVSYAGIPYGIMAHVTGRRYAECLLFARAGLLVLRDSRQHHPASVPLDAVLAIDASALAVGARLGESRWQRLTSFFASLLIADIQHEDIRQSQQGQSPNTVATVTWDAASQRVAVFELTPESVQDAAALFESMVSAAKLCQTTRVDRAAELSEAPEGSDVWLAGISLAIRDGIPLWVDDVGLERLAASHGVAAFSTLDLLDFASDAGRLDAEYADEIRGELRRIGAVDLPLGDNEFVDFARSEQWGGVAAMHMARPYAWSDPQRAMRLLARVIDLVFQENRASIPFWIFHAARGIGAVATRGREIDAMVRVVTPTMFHSLIAPTDVGPIVSALREATASLELTDPIPEFARYWTEQSIKAFGPSLGAARVTQLVQSLPAADRDVILKAVLT
jgi:hypothetical protein